MTPPPAQRLLRLVPPDRAERPSRAAVDPGALHDATVIIEDVRRNGLPALSRYAVRFGERAANDPILYTRADLRRVLDASDPETRALLERTAARIERFARAQRDCLLDLDAPIPGGVAGHRFVPVASAGCYAPAGLHPLPSSVLMTAIVARVAGCPRVVVASPGARPIMLAAAAIAGADEFLTVGGAHAVAALAHGFEGFAPCDLIVGPGNRYVTAAKHAVSASVGIDMLAGPSELLVLADASADPALVAADLLAQAEHDPDALPMLISTDAAIIEQVELELRRRLGALPTRTDALAALANGFACAAPDLPAAIDLCNRLAPEHLEVLTTDPQAVAQRLTNAGAVFIGPLSAEVLGDYGAGPNHTLPTGGAARWSAGLSVLHFLRARTYLRINDPDAAAALVADGASLARLEGLEAHALAAERRATVSSGAA